MKTNICIFFALLIALVSLSAYADDYNARQATHYTQEAEYYQKKAEGYRKEAQYYLKQAENNQREAAYYTRKGDTSRAKEYNRRAERAMDNYETQMRYAANAEQKAADNLKKAAYYMGKVK